jgi:filamentous hemagglutinin
VSSYNNDNYQYNYNGYHGGIHNAGRLLAGVGAGTDVPVEGQGSIKLQLSGERAPRPNTVNTGTIAAGKDASVEAYWMEFVGGSLSAPGKLSLNNAANPGLVKISEARVSGGTVQLQASQLDSTRGEVTAAGDLTIAAGSLTNQGGKLSAGGNLTAPIPYTLDNSRGSLSAGGTLRLSAMQLTNAEGMITGKSVVLDIKESPTTYSSGHVDNTGGLIEASETLTLSAPWPWEQAPHAKAPHASWRYPVTLKNQGGKLIAGGSLTATVPYELNNTQGTLSAGSDLSLRTHKLANVGGAITGQTVSATLQPSYWHPESSRRPDARDGHVRSDGSTDYVDNSGGLIQAQEALTLTAGTISNTNTYSGDASRPLGLIGKVVTLTSNSGFNNTQGLVTASETLKLRTDRLTNGAGLVASSRSAHIEVGLLENIGFYNASASPGKISADEHLSINAAALWGEGTLQSEGDLLLTIKHDPQRWGWLTQGG